MRWSRLLITTALSLFVIFGLIDAINAQRGSVRFDRQRSHSSSSSSRPWIDDTVLLESEENYSRSNVRRRIPTSQAVEQSSRTIASRSRSRPTKAQPTSTRSQELDSSEEDFEQRLTTKEQFAPSLRSEVVYQNEFARRSDKGSEETVQQRRKSRLRAGSDGTTSTSTVASVRGGRKLGGRGSSSSRFSNEVEEVVPSSSTRSVESRTRGKIKAISKERNEDVASDENYPEEFKKLLKAKFKENKLKTVNKLESSTENELGKSSEKDVPRFKVKVLSTTTEGTTTTVKVITPRPARKFASASSGESNATSRPVPSRSRSSSSEESSENSRSRSRASSPIVSTPRSSKKLVTPRSRTSSSTTTTTTEESFATEIASTTPRPTRAYSRRPSIVSQLTSTTTTSTTTRKPYSPTTRSSAPGKRTFSAPSTASGSLSNFAETESKRDNSFVISSLRNPSAFRSTSAQRQSRKPSNAEINNEVKPVVIPSRSKALSSLNTLKRSQSVTGSRVPNRFESNLKKTPVYTPTIPSFRSTPPSTSTTQLTGYDDTDWDWPSVTEPAGLLNRLPPPLASSNNRRPTSGPARWPSYSVAPIPSSSTTAYHYEHSSSAYASEHPFRSVDESLRRTRKNKNLSDLEHRRVFAANARAVDDDVHNDDNVAVRWNRIRAKKMSVPRPRTQQNRRREGRRFTNRMRSNLDYYTASSSSSSSLTSLSSSRVSS